MPNRFYVDVRRAERSDIKGMLSIFGRAFDTGNARLAPLMYTENPSVEALNHVVKDILNTHLDTEDCGFLVAYENGQGIIYESENREVDTDNNLHSGTDMENGLDPESDTDNGLDSDSDTDILTVADNLTMGWISVCVTHGATRNAYAASELITYACLRVLVQQARARGEDHLNINDRRVRLLNELNTRSKNGQARYITNHSHLVVNALLLWPEGHQDTDQDMALKLLGRAVDMAETKNLPIWAQITLNQTSFFRDAGFREVEVFALTLNSYAPYGGTDWGTKEWVQMVYSPSGRGVVGEVN